MATATQSLEIEETAPRTWLAANPSKEWWLMLPLLFFSTHGAFSFQSGGEYQGGFLPGNVATRDPGFVGYVLLPGIAYSVAFWLILQNWRRVLDYAVHFKVLTCLAVMTVLSATWSQAPLRSAEFGVFYCACTLFAYSLVIHFEPQEIMSLMMKAGVVIALLSLFLVVVFPDFGLAHDPSRPGAWEGIFFNRTAAAKCLVFLLSPALTFWIKGFAGKRILYLLLLGGMLIQARTVTSIIVTAAFVLFLVLLHFGRALGARASAVLFPIGCIVALVLGKLAIGLVPDIFRAFGRNTTLTGRTLIWSALLGSIEKHPFLGYGFYAFWQGLTGESGAVIHATHWTFGYAHNGILEILVQLGFVGLVLVLVTMAGAIKNAWYCIRNDSSGRYDWYIGLIVLTLLFNFDEETLLFPNELLSILYIVACCGLAKAAWELKQAKRLEGSYVR